MVIAVINGPNMNLLGMREPEHYGNQKWNDIEKKLVELSAELNCELLFCQSNHEGAIVDFIQEHLYEMDGIIINPAGFSKTGYAILDAMNALNTPYVEIHMSNIYFRGTKHNETIFQEDAIGNIVGFRGNSYMLGLRAMVDYLNSLSYES